MEGTSLFRTKNPAEYCILLGHNGSRVGRVTTPRSVKFKFIALYAETLEGLEGERDANGTDLAHPKKQKPNTKR